ncbi:MAG TPA: hypothetical protein VGI88_00105 [Verrucomicrobiae bacterium]|jgi:hypothetical protein
MNQEAGRGGWLIVTFQMESGESLPLIVDTGCPVTCFDQSLEPKLGKRLADANFLNWGVSHSGGAYQTSKLYSGNTQLRSSSLFVVTLDCKWMSAIARRPVMGILGMDVMKHYCIQLDFQNDQMRFLDGTHADTNDWGRPFRLSHLSDGCITITENLTGEKGPPSLVDTGSDHDGVLVSKLFQQWTNHAGPPAPGEIHSPDGILGGEIYHNVKLTRLERVRRDSHTRFNMIGLQLLSRNLVTFDFPNRMMYLKRTGERPLANKD